MSISIGCYQMAAEKFNSVGGFSVGIPAISVVDSSGNVVTNVNTSGNVTANLVNVLGNLMISNVANLKIPGGLNGYFLQTDGSGNLTWAASGGGGGTGVPGGSNTQVLYNQAGAFGGSANFTFNETTNTLHVDGNITSNVDISANGNVSGNYILGSSIVTGKHS